MDRSGELSNALAKAVARIEKEIERYERAPATMRVGGITQVSKVVEVVMKAALHQVCATERLDAEVELLQNTHARSMSKATLGHLMEAVKVIPSRERSTSPLRRDLEQRRSALWRFLDIRNTATVHPGRPEPTPQVMLPVLRDLLKVIKGAQAAST